jgi:hypothetical protein
MSRSLSRFGVAAVPGKAWAVGVALDSGFAAHSVIESWDGKAWKLDRTPNLDSERDMLFSATAVNDHDVYAAGIAQNEDGTFQTLIEHFDGRDWERVATPNPGDFGDQLFGIAAAGPDDVYAVGQRNDVGADTPLVLHYDGHGWDVVHVPGASAALLQGVTAKDGQVWAVGQTDDAKHQAFPFVEHLAGGHWTAETLHNVGTSFSDITGVAVDVQCPPRPSTTSAPPSATSRASRSTAAAPRGWSAPRTTRARTSRSRSSRSTARGGGPRWRRPTPAPGTRCSAGSARPAGTCGPSATPRPTRAGAR